jgi:uncharacterized membrane protein
MLLIALAGWTILSPFVWGADLKKRIETLEAQVAALRRLSAPPPARETQKVAYKEPQIIPPENAAPQVAAAKSDKHTPSGWDVVEQWLIQRWIIAAGGLTVALGGLFTVRYSIEQGLLGPTTRIILGALVGIALVSGAEWVRRYMLARTLESRSLAAQQVPAALAAAGWITLYGVVYSAHAFYDLLPATITFILLATIAGGSLTAGLLYGPLAGALGAGLGLLAPALVASDRPNAEILFPYLFVVTAGVFALIRYRPWPWLAWLALSGNGLWQLVWALSIGGQQAPIRALHLLAIPVMSAYLLLRDPWPQPEESWWRWDWSKAPLPVWTVAATVLGSFGLLWLLATQTGFDGIAAAAWGIGLALLMLLAHRAPTQLPLLPIVAIMTVGLIAAWVIPVPVSHDTMVLHSPGLFFPNSFTAYVGTVAAYAAIFGIGGFILLWRSLNPGLWASLSVTVPLAALTVLYARLSASPQSLPWAGTAIALAVFYSLAADRLTRHRPRTDAPLAAYAAGVTAGVALAATMALQAAWLTVALALELPAMAWIWHRTNTKQIGLPGLRVMAGIIAAVLLVRLVFNPYIAGYAVNMPILLNWMLYGYGVPTIACWVSARWFRAVEGEDWVTWSMQAAALAFGTALMTLELWHIASGGGQLFSVGMSLRQASAIGNGWLMLGLILLRLDRNKSEHVRRWGWQLIGAAGVAWSVIVTLLTFNPLWTSIEVGSTLVINLVLFAYGLPALLLALSAMELATQRQITISRIITAISILFLIITVLLEIRQAFHGDRLDIFGVSEAENYSYSLGMLLIALGLLASGLRWLTTDLRHAGFALLAIALGKAFLIDMDRLTGLWRAGSFLGLGLCLIGVGYTYQRLRRVGVS